ncbi:succinyl-diaminopimelate desuccinylase [Legionella birminghamensis]|uniref:Succinyl-diaminopimelate desuccinylase n=1 Tax=Legionella birminghamensis TaxID=28083 RepID=A0A378IA11_9GAMM|nr:succinyl-diaminopimelate desuccinylase [Legionella birminghamensis]KTC75166.1 succinyl-diaminopimelate desuccinylase [Legionella birminghamensis]STX31883.1 succinyl-diaminopimelate desuccinylase [Legionella birminghamensis]
MSSIYEILSDLIERESITPFDAGCQESMLNYLSHLGFTCHPFNNGPVNNFFARYGISPPLLVFAGHTDVVPIGNGAQWQTPPFELTLIGDKLHGRGTADMKGSLAAMMLAAKRFIDKFPSFPGSLGFLITSGEEGDLFQLGTPYVMEELSKSDVKIDYCIVGEPSSTERIADVIKIGRRGSLTGNLILRGKQGHVAYPHLARNPIHQISPALAELALTEWDCGNEHFPPTSFQITALQSGGIASNIIPGDLSMQFNFRYSTEQTAQGLQRQVMNIFQKHALSPELEWRINGEPFLTNQGKLLDATVHAIEKVTHHVPELSTSGGTSDGRFIAPYGVEVIELGPVNATIHQVNECVSLSDLEKLAEIYYGICEQLLM